MMLTTEKRYAEWCARGVSSHADQNNSGRSISSMEDIALLTALDAPRVRFTTGAAVAQR
jgi:hypothetical protein